MRDEHVSNSELCDILERNGFPGASERIAGGADPYEATRYIVGQKPHYDDSEGWWLHDYLVNLKPRGEVQYD